MNGKSYFWAALVLCGPGTLTGCTRAALEAWTYPSMSDVDRRVEAKAGALWAQWFDAEQFAEGERIREALRPLVEDFEELSRRSVSLQRIEEIREASIARSVDEQQAMFQLETVKLNAAFAKRLDLPQGTTVKEYVAAQHATLNTRFEKGIEALTARLQSSIEEKIQDLEELFGQALPGQQQIPHEAVQQLRELEAEVQALDQLKKLAEPGGFKSQVLEVARNEGFDWQDFSKVRDKTQSLPQWHLAGVSGGSLLLALLGFVWRSIGSYSGKIEKAANDATYARAAVETLQKQLPQKINANVKLEPQNKA